METPHERQVISAVISLWKEDPSTEQLGSAKLHARIRQRNPNWQLSEKRLKTLLKSYGLQLNAPQFTYASEIRSAPISLPDLPPQVRLQKFGKSKGQGLAAARAIPAGTLLWKESPLFLVPPLDHVALIRKFMACTFCARPFQIRNLALDCGQCGAVWCNSSCRRADRCHAVLYHSHSSRGPKTVDATAWRKYEDFCVAQQWRAAHAVGFIRVSGLKDADKLAVFESAACVSQAVRQKAINDAPLAAEQTEELWRSGYSLLREAIPGLGDGYSYERYLEDLGTFNLNNIDGCLYRIQSHLNHSCDPNVEVKIISRAAGLEVRARRDIAVNEELTTCYVNPRGTLAKRRNELRVEWGFICNCSRCKSEDKAVSGGASVAAVAAAVAAAPPELLETPEAAMHAVEQLRREALNAEQEFEIVPETGARQRRKSVRFDAEATVLKG